MVFSVTVTWFESSDVYIQVSSKVGALLKFETWHH